MHRCQKGQPVLLSLPVTEKVSAGTITITRDRDSTVLVNAQSVTVQTNRVEYTLAAQSDEASLTAVWTLSQSSGTATITEVVQITSVRACTIDQVRRLRPLDDINRYPNWLLDQAITMVEDQLETATGVSFTGREFDILVDGSGTRDQYVPVGRPRSITYAATITAAPVGSEQVSVAGPLTSTEISQLVIDDRQGTVYRPVIWSPGRRNIRLRGVCGFAETPGMLSAAVAKQVRYLLIDSPAQDRAISVTDEAGMTQSMVVAGLRGAHFAIPELNVVVDTYRNQFGIA